MIIHDNLIQGSELWEKARLGILTASNFSKVFTAKTRKLSESADDHINTLLAEAWGNDEADFVPTKWMEQGTDSEPEARAAFAKATGFNVMEVGFIERNGGIVGASPDAMILRDGVDFERDAIRDDGGRVINGLDLFRAGLEMKVPKRATHIGYFRRGDIPTQYVQQIHGGMAVTGLKEWFFWSYNKILNPVLIRVMADDYTAALSAALDEFVIKYATVYREWIPKLRQQK